MQLSYNKWFDIQDDKESDDVKTLDNDILPMPAIEVDEEEGK